MIHTFPEGEFKIPAGLAPPGMKAWRWIELSMQKPYFLVALLYEDPDLPSVRHLVCASLDDVLDLDRRSEPNVKIQSISAMCPGYMSESDTYQMEQIIQIWTSPRDPYEEMYLTADGRKLRFCFASDPTPEYELKCVLKIGK